MIAVDGQSPERLAAPLVPLVIYQPVALMAMSVVLYTSIHSVTFGVVSSDAGLYMTSVMIRSPHCTHTLTVALIESNSPSFTWNLNESFPQAAPPV